MRDLRFLAACALFAAGILVAVAREPASPAPYLGAIVTDAETGRIIFEDNADTITPPASMTKLMTFAVLHDKLVSGALTLQTPVTVTRADAKVGMIKDSTSVWLKEKEVFPVEELLYAMMIRSANDAAFALARFSAGSPEAFVELMNAKARSLGMTRTTFRTPHGLPPADRQKADGDLSTPRDYAILSRYLLLETDVTKYTSVRSRLFGAGRPTGPVKMENHNHLLGKVVGLDGLKTGFTNGASFCLAATAERNSRRVIVVAMGSPDSRTRDLKVAELIERGFAALPPRLSVKTDSLTSSPPAVGAGTPATPDDLPTVTTDKTAPPAAGDSSTSTQPPLTFRVIPPHKSP